MSTRVYMMWKKLLFDKVTPAENEDHDISYYYEKQFG